MNYNLNGLLNKNDNQGVVFTELYDDGVDQNYYSEGNYGLCLGEATSGAQQLFLKHYIDIDTNMNLKIDGQSVTVSNDCKEMVGKINYLLDVIKNKGGSYTVGYKKSLRSILDTLFGSDGKIQKLSNVTFNSYQSNSTWDTAAGTYYSEYTNYKECGVSISENGTPSEYTKSGVKYTYVPVSLVNNGRSKSLSISCSGNITVSGYATSAGGTINTDYSSLDDGNYFIVLKTSKSNASGKIITVSNKFTTYKGRILIFGSANGQNIAATAVKPYDLTDSDTLTITGETKKRIYLEKFGVDRSSSTYHFNIMYIAGIKFSVTKKSDGSNVGTLSTAANGVTNIISNLPNDDTEYVITETDNNIYGYKHNVGKSLTTTASSYSSSPIMFYNSIALGNLTINKIDSSGNAIQGVEMKIKIITSDGTEKYLCLMDENDDVSEVEGEVSINFKNKANSDEYAVAYTKYSGNATKFITNANGQIIINGLEVYSGVSNGIKQKYSYQAVEINNSTYGYGYYSNSDTASNIVTLTLKNNGKEITNPDDVNNALGMIGDYSATATINFTNEKKLGNISVEKVDSSSTSTKLHNVEMQLQRTDRDTDNYYSFELRFKIGSNVYRANKVYVEKDSNGNKQLKIEYGELNTWDTLGTITFSDIQSNTVEIVCAISGTTEVSGKIPTWSVTNGICSNSTAEFGLSIGGYYTKFYTDYNGEITVNGLETNYNASTQFKFKAVENSNPYYGYGYINNDSSKAEVDLTINSTSSVKFTNTKALGNLKIVKYGNTSKSTKLSNVEVYIKRTPHDNYPTDNTKVAYMQLYAKYNGKEIRVKEVYVSNSKLTIDFTYTDGSGSDSMSFDNISTNTIKITSKVRSDLPTISSTDKEAKFMFAEPSTSTNATKFKTDSSGQIKINNVEKKYSSSVNYTYTVEEINNPNYGYGYYNKDTTKPSAATSTFTDGVATLNLINESKVGNLTVEKVDVNDNNVKLHDAKMKIQRTIDGTNNYSTFSLRFKLNGTTYRVGTIYTEKDSDGIEYLKLDYTTLTDPSTKLGTIKFSKMHSTTITIVGSINGSTVYGSIPTLEVDSGVCSYTLAPFALTLDGNWTYFYTDYNGQITINNLETNYSSATQYKFKVTEISNPNYGYKGSTNGDISTDSFTIDGSVTKTMTNTGEYGNLKIEKVDSRDNSIKLPDVELKISNDAGYIALLGSDGKIISSITNSIDKDGNTVPIKISKIPNAYKDNTTNKYLYETTYKNGAYGIKYVSSAADATTFITNKDGIIEIDNLEVYKGRKDCSGDVNLDGKVNLADVELIQGYIANPENYNWSLKVFNNADVNSDGKINSADVDIINDSITNNKDFFSKYTYSVEEVKTDEYYKLLEEPVEGTLTKNTTWNVSNQSNGTKLENKQIYVDITGYAWRDEYHDKAAGKDVVKERNGLYDDGELRLEGATVRLINSKTGKVVVTDAGETCETKTDKNGEYIFNKVLIEELADYYVEFTYDGYTYTSVELNLDKTNGSKAQEIATSRTALNNRYSLINKNFSNTDVSVIATTNEAEYSLAQHTPGKKKIENVNLGLVEREKPDIALASSTDIAEVDTKINGKSYTYTMKAIEGVEETKTNSYASLVDRLDARSMKVYEGDVAYSKTLPKNDTNSLKLYVTYKIAIQNQSDTLQMAAKEIVNYFDQNVTLVGSSWAEDKNGKTIVDKVEWTTKSGSATYQGYQTMYTTSVSSYKLQPDEIIYIYVQVQVNDETLLSLLNDKGEEQDPILLYNVSEVSAYTTYYTDKTFEAGKTGGRANEVYGQLDIDSSPENASPLKPEEWEDDTKGTPTLNISINARGISGTVWEDSAIASKLTDSNERIGNGILDSNENKVKNVKVELIDANTNEVAKIYNAENMKGVDAVTTTNEKGEYSFIGVIPGEYLIRYTYGNVDGTQTQIVTSSGNIDVNARDYKSTIINANSGSYGPISGNTTTDYWYIDEHNMSDNKVVRYSDATDNLSLRSEISDYIYSDSNAYSMTAQTPGFSVGIEYTDTNFESEVDGNGNVNFTKVQGNVDFGIIERPRLAIDVTKKVTYMKVTLQSGTVLIEGNPSDKTVKMSYTKTGLDGIVPSEVETELLQGAKLEATYTIYVANHSEVDYDYTKDASYYIFGIKNKSPQKITAGIVDYIDDTVEIDASNYEDGGNGAGGKWKTTTVTELNDYISSDVKNTLKNGYNVSGETRKLNVLTTSLSDIAFDETKSVTMVVNKLLAATLEINVNNFTEVVKVSGSQGKTIRDTSGNTMIPGNYDPANTANTDEADSDTVKIAIAPPTGDTKVTSEENVNMLPILVTGLAIIAIGITTMIIVIRKKKNRA